MSVSIFRSQDIIEDGEERLEAEMALEESLRTLRVVEGWLAAEDTKSGPGSWAVGKTWKDSGVKSNMA